MLDGARLPGIAAEGGGGGIANGLLIGAMIPMDVPQKYVGLTLVRGDDYGRRLRVRTAKEIELEDRMRRAFGRCKTAQGTHASRAVKDITNGQGAPWSKMAKRAIEMDEAGLPADLIKDVCVGTFAAWLDEMLSKPKRAA